MFSKRTGSDPHANDAKIAGCDRYSEIVEFVDADSAIIGVGITDIASSLLPRSAGCVPDERIAGLPINLFGNAKQDIPNRI
jgi:hypothetical protein